ncbi:M20 family peptidase, partial [Arthrobacter sp. GCM10027362]
MTPGSPSPAEQAVLAQVRPDEIEVLAARLIDAGGGNPGGTEAATVAVLEAEARRLGFEADVRPVAPGRPNILATLAPEAP